MTEDLMSIGSCSLVTGLSVATLRHYDEPHRGHISAFGLAVSGLEATHRRAIAAGAIEQYPPTDGVNMPRHSLIVDPVGNRVVLWESGSEL